MRVQRGVALQDGSQRANSDQKDSWSRVARVSAWCKVKCVVAEKLSTGCMKFFVILRLYFGCHYHHQLSAVSFMADKKKLYRSTVQYACPEWGIGSGSADRSIIIDSIY